jgi:hypothetical protein
LCAGYCPRNFCRPSWQGRGPLPEPA